MIAGALSPNQFVDASARTRKRLAATTAGCTVAASAASNAAAMAVAWPDAASACAAAALSQLTYCVATVIIAVDDAPCHEPLARSDVTEKNDDADDTRSSASPFHAV